MSRYQDPPKFGSLLSALGVDEPQEEDRFASLVSALGVTDDVAPPPMERTAGEVPEYLRQPTPTEPIEDSTFPGLEPRGRSSGFLGGLKEAGPVRRNVAVGLGVLARTTGDVMETVGRMAKAGTPEMRDLSDPGFLGVPPEHQTVPARAEASTPESQFLERKGAKLAARGQEILESVPTQSFREIRNPVDLGNFIVGAMAQAATVSAPILGAGVAGMAAAGPPGAAAGALGASYALGYSELLNTLMEPGGEYEGIPRDLAERVAAVGAVPYAALERIVPGHVLERWMATSVGKLTARLMLKNMAKAAIKEAPIEYLTEAAQSYVEQIAANITTGKPIDHGQALLEEGPAGFFGGAGLGAVSAARPHAAPTAPTITPRVETEQEAAIRRGVETPMTMEELEERLAVQESPVSPSEPLPSPEPVRAPERARAAKEAAVTEPTARVLTPEEVRARNLSERDPLTGALTLDPMDRPTFQRRKTPEPTPPNLIPERELGEGVEPAQLREEADRLQAEAHEIAMRVDALTKSPDGTLKEVQAGVVAREAAQKAADEAQATWEKAVEGLPGYGDEVAVEPGAPHDQAGVDRGKPPTEGFVVANVGADGQSYYGKPGQLHIELSQQYPHEVRGDWERVGFAGPDGVVLTREEAMAKVEEEEGQVTKPRGSLGPLDRDGGLDAKDYQEWTRRRADLEREAIETVDIQPAAEEPATTPGPTDADLGLGDNDLGVDPAEEIYSMPVANILADPERFQFKQLGETGVSDELKGVRTWNPKMAGVISVWRDPADGKVYVVNGHNRLDLAQRLGRERVNVQFIQAADDKAARSAGAIINISEGRGTSVDVAKFMRDMNATAEDLAAEGVSLKGDLARRGTALSRLAPDIFDEVATGKIQQIWGVAIGEILEEPALQRQALSVVRGKRLSGPEVREVARQVGVAGTEDVTQETLFGTETETQSLFVERAQVATAVKRKLAADRRLFGFVAKEGRAEELQRAGGTQIDVKAAQEIAQTSATAEEIFERLYTRSGPVANLVSEGARRLKHGEKTKAIVADIYSGIGDAVRQEIQSVSGRPESSEGSQEGGNAPAIGVESGRGQSGQVVPEGTDLFGEQTPVAESPSQIPTPEELDATPLSELLITRESIKKEMRSGGDMDAVMALADQLDMVDTAIADRTNGELDPQYATYQAGLFGFGELVEGDEQTALFEEEGRQEKSRLRAQQAKLAQEALDTPLSPADIARLKREGVEPEGERPLALFNESISEGTGPFETQPATVEVKSKDAPETRTLHPISPVELTRLVIQLLGGNKIFMRKYPQAHGAFYPDPTNPRIGLNPELGKDYEQFAKTLAHEAGHLTDFMSDRNMNRGNILGRIGSLADYLKSTLDKEPTNPSKALTPKDRRKIRSMAEKDVGPKPAKDNEADLAAWREEVSRRYRERILDEMDVRNLMGRQAVHEELLLLSEWWRPYDPDVVTLGHQTYRESSKELYADAVSVLLNSPGSLQERAPTFFDAFLNYLERKPEVQKAYDAIQELVGQGEDAIYEARKADTEAGYALGREKEREVETKKDPQSLPAHFKQALVSRAAPIVGAENKRLGRLAASSEQRVLKMILQEYNHADNVNRLMLGEFSERVHKPMTQAEITSDQAGMYLENMRIAEGDRGGYADHAREAIMDLTGEKTWKDARAAFVALTEEDSDYDPGLLQIADGGILNPRGNTPQEARKTLAGLKKELGDEKYAQLEGFMKEFRAILFTAMEEGVKVGSISQEIFRNTIFPNKDTYVPFAVLDYYNGRMTASVKQQIGTVKGIANPYDTAIMKAMAMNRLNERQKAVIAVVDILDVDFPGAASEERAIDRYHREQKPGKGKRNLTYLRDGKLYYREVDEYIALTLEKSDLGRMQRMASWYGSKTYGFLHPLYVTWSLAWQVRNIQRDYKRTYKNLAAAHGGKPTYRQAIEAVLDIGRTLRAYKQTSGVAWGHARHRSNAQMRAMLKDRALGRAFHSFEANEQDMTHERLLQRYGYLVPEGKGFARSLRRFGSPVETLGVFQETWSKAAAYKMLGEMGITGQQRAYMVRNYTGTPDSTERGLVSDVSNSLFMYFNVILAGLRADAEVAFKPETAAGYWMRSTLIDFAPKALMAAAVLGWLGDDLKEWYDRIPGYDLEKYLIVPVPPFWSTNDKGDKKAIYMRLPHDDANRILAATSWALLTSGNPYPVGHAVGVLSGEFPGISPPIAIGLVDLAQLASGRNPYDEFRGRDIVPRTQWDAGGWSRWKEMGRHAMRQFGIVSQVMGRWLYDSPEEGEAAPGEELLRSIPGLSSMIKITDRGLNEENYWELDWDRRNRARLRLDLSQSVRRATSERSRLNSLGVDRLTEKQETRRNQLNMWYTQFYRPIAEEMEGRRDAGEDVAYKAARDRLNESVARIGELSTQGNRTRRSRRTRRR